jgi:peptide-methionine (R)-S-oxide reductase
MTRPKKDQQELRSELTEEQYRVTQEQGTEPAFTGKYWDMKEDGVYSCVCCGTELFRSDEKFDSGTGWPSFWVPLAGDRVRTQIDDSHGMRRVEATCDRCGCHLGHVFDDGPRESTGKRFCINSLSLNFEAKPDE